MYNRTAIEFAISFPNVIAIQENFRLFNFGTNNLHKFVLQDELNHATVYVRLM